MWGSSKIELFCDPTTFERFRDKVVPEPNSGCWLWIGAVNYDNYGFFHFDGIQRTAHRAAWIMLRGDPGKHLHVDHLCRNRRCVNPDHLEPVPPRVNWARSMSTSAVNARRTECLNGHPFNDANTYVTRDGRRTCRKCQNERCKAYKKRQKKRRGE